MEKALVWMVSEVNEYFATLFDVFYTHTYTYT